MTETAVYLEYGSGGSTLLAAKSAKFIVSVDSDRAYLSAVAAALTAAKSRCERELIYVDIGIVGEWGVPVFRNPTKRRRDRWKMYSKAPWEFLYKHDLRPNTVLIDGRFRVACALECFLRSNGNSCRILVDDYGDRPEYAAIEQFGELAEMGGRMALFFRKPNFDAMACRDALEDWYFDPS